MTDIVQDLIILNGVPNGLVIPNLILHMYHLGNQSPDDSKKCKNDNVVKYTKSTYPKTSYKKKYNLCVTLFSRSLFVSAPLHAVNRLMTVGNKRKNKARTIGPNNAWNKAQNFVCRFNSAPNAGQKTPRFHRFVTNVAMRALGTVHAIVRRKKSMFPTTLFVLRRVLGIARFFQRISEGRGARKTDVPWMCLFLFAWATMWACGIAE
jgi:hypothetical protein